MKRVNVRFDVWIQLLGMLGVLGGLVFVGLEMRQSQMIAQAGQQQDRTAAFFGLIGSNNEAGVDWQSTVYDATSEYSGTYSNRRSSGAIIITRIYSLMRTTTFSTFKD